MNALSPSIWYVVAAAVALVGVWATVVCMRSDRLDIVGASIAVGSFVGAGGIMLKLPSSPDRALVVAVFLLGVVFLLDALRRTFKRHQGGRPGAAPGAGGGPPDIESIP